MISFSFDVQFHKVFLLLSFVSPSLPPFCFQFSLEIEFFNVSSIGLELRTLLHLLLKCWDFSFAPSSLALKRKRSLKMIELLYLLSVIFLTCSLIDFELRSLTM